MWSAILAFLLASPGSSTPIPGDVMRCIEQRKMWVAAPEFFESLEIQGEGAKRERAYQILDHKDGMTGHLLVTPSSCRIVVFITPGETLSFDPSTRPTIAELRSLLKWAGYREIERGPMVARTFLREGNVVWFYDGHTLQLVELETGQVRRVEVR